MKMGGGDLNSKKSWHPNTIKNQERVWKAEQAAAEEKKRMVELQRERAEERDRAELNDIMAKRSSSTTSDNRLAWMYDKPDKKVEQEAYLLGRAIDKNADQTESVEQDPIPAVSRRVVGSSMLTAAGDTQVDMGRKIREDPLLLIKERERAARAALLNNPLQRRRLAELLRKEQDQRKESKQKKKSKKKDKDLDDLLTAKLNALGGQKGIDLATLLDSSSDSEEEKSNKKKKRKSKKKKKRKQSSDNESDDSTHKSNKNRPEDKKDDVKDYKKHGKETRKRKSSESPRRSESPLETKYKKKEMTSDRRNNYDAHYKSTRQYDKNDFSGKYSSHRRSSSRDIERKKRESNQKDNKKRVGITEEEKAARLAQMAAAGAEREVERGKRVAEQRAAEVAAEHRAPLRSSSSRHEARALPESLESRIHSNRHYIQRDKRHMNENFARR